MLKNVDFLSDKFIETGQHLQRCATLGDGTSIAG